MIPTTESNLKTRTITIINIIGAVLYKELMFEQIKQVFK